MKGSITLDILHAGDFGGLRVELRSK